jgi:25S rRNA (uracil2634-N3)-methyltransferase
MGSRRQRVLRRRRAEVIKKTKQARQAMKLSQSKDKPKRHPLQELFSKENKLLIVGDGDFSFAAALLRLVQPEQITASSYDSKQQVLSKYPSSQFKLHALEKAGAKILHGIDGRNLEKYFEKKAETDSFNVIIWNFPHSGQQRVHVNRVLLREFFASCSKVIESQGQVVVTLKKGSPYDHWNIEEQASLVDLTLKKSIPFDKTWFPGYAHRTTDPEANDVQAYQKASRMYIFQKN